MSLKFSRGNLNDDEFIAVDNSTVGDNFLQGYVRFNYQYTRYGIPYWQRLCQMPDSNAPSRRELMFDDAFIAGVDSHVYANKIAGYA